MSHPLSGPQKVVVVGTEATMTFDPFSPRIELYNTEPDFVEPAVDPHDPMGMWGASHPAYNPVPKRRWVPLGSGDVMADDVAAFVAAIESGAQPDMNARRAAELTEVILGGFVSAARGEEVSLQLPRG